MAKAVEDDAKDEIIVENADPAPAEPDIKVETVENPDKSVVSAAEGVEELKRRLAAADQARQNEASARAEAEQRARFSENTAYRAQNEAQASNLSLIESALGAIKQSTTALKQSYAQALANQDYDRAAEIQEEMAGNAVKRMQLETGKQQLQARQPIQAQPPQMQDQVEAVAQTLAPRSAAWVRAHPEYVRNPRLNEKMIAAHHLAKELGIESDAYFQQIEQTLGISRKEEAPESALSEASGSIPRRSSPSAAPPSRSGASPGSNPRVVRLTQDEIEMARLSDITPEEYAKNKRKLENEGKYH